MAMCTGTATTGEIAAVRIREEPTPASVVSVGSEPGRRAGVPPHIAHGVGRGRANNDRGKKDAFIVRNQVDRRRWEWRRCHEIAA